MADDLCMRYLVIANPTAGRGRARRITDAVCRELRSAAASVEVLHTTRRGAAQTLAEGRLAVAPSNNGERLCVVACGGDGTIQEVVNALMNRPEAKGVLGLAPSGRCNDFASSFGIRPDPAQIARVLTGGHLRRVDIGRVNDRYYCTIAATGFDAAVSRFVNDMKLPLRGTLAYVYGVLRVLRNYTPADLRLSFYDSTGEAAAPRNGPTLMVSSANTLSYGGKMRVAPNASAFDGKLDICIVSPMRRLRVLRLLRSVMQGRHTELREVSFVRTPRLRIESDAPHEIWADGEPIAKTPATIEIVPSAVEVLLPIESDG
ncbi:MAG: diacylglycerol kinase family lipid kinase [Planctomycetota bacterium]|nr:diacylglycerol kinase family lipid kinase [Planctomycetota bacterium]